MKKSKLSKIKKGEFFRFPGQKKTYIFQGGGPVRGFEYIDTSDISSFKRTKTDREIEIGFTY